MCVLDKWTVKEIKDAKKKEFKHYGLPETILYESP
jgi:hypothetical protein